MSFKFDLTYLGSDACVWWYRYNTFLYTFRTLSTYLVHRWRYTVNMLPFWLMQTANC